MSGPMKPLNPGQTMNIGSINHLTQIQHKGDRVDIVDHFDHGPTAVDAHIVTTIRPNGKIDIDY
jgi:hypothetical protein